MRAGSYDKVKRSFWTGEVKEGGILGIPLAFGVCLGQSHVTDSFLMCVCSTHTDRLVCTSVKAVQLVPTPATARRTWMPSSKT